MFAVVRSVLLEPLPYSGSERPVRIYHAISGNRWKLSVADFQAIEAQQTQFDGVAAYASGERTFTAGDVAERVRVRAVAAGWFDLRGIRPMQGRTFEPADGEPGAPLTALVSWGFWQRQMGADATAVGRTIRLGGEDFAVIGILPRQAGPLRKDIGIRLALGGTAPGVIALVIGRGMKPVLLGGAIGFVIAAGVTRFISRLLFGVSPYDPTTMGIVALAMLGTAAAACWLPARHAARLDPAQVLRHD